MGRFQVHYELYIRRTPAASWALEMASENRAQVVGAAEQMMAEGVAAAVRVSKETFDPETHEFQTVSIFSRGAVESGRRRVAQVDDQPLCVTPEDLYSLHARDRIGRLLEGWLNRNRATPFELLHRPDLVELLDAEGNELQHAVQKISVPEAQARGLSTHELMRTFHALIERAIMRVMGDARRGRFPDLGVEPFAEAAQRLAAEPDAAYLLGVGVAGSLASAESWSDKTMRLLDLADAAPAEGAARRLAFEVLEQPLSEILESRAGLVGLLGGDLDLGGQLAAMTQLVAHDQVAALVAMDAQIATRLPPLEGPAARLAGWLAQPPFEGARAAVGRRILRELTSPKRIRPSSPREEIELLRALGMTLTAAAGQLLPLEGVQESFAARSRMLVTADFVEALLGRDGAARDEAEQLTWLCENVVGAANKRQAARYLVTHLGSLRFETEMRDGAETAAHRLAALAAMQKSAARTGLDPADLASVQTRLGEVGALVEADAKLVAALTHSPAPVGQRLSALLKLATGEAAPLGPAAEKAREAATKLLRSQTVRSELAATPEQLAHVREMIQAAGLAA